MRTSPDSTHAARPVLYLDIDGTVRQGKDDALGRLANGPEDVRVFPEAIDRMREWRSGGGLIAGVSNQGGIALRIVSESRVAKAMAETNRQTDGLFDVIWWCRHHPRAKRPELARCRCRKPAPGAIIEAAKALQAHRIAAGYEDETYPPELAVMVGDRPEDRACARAVGVSFLWADAWRAGAPYEV